MRHGRKRSSDLQVDVLEGRALLSTAHPAAPSATVQADITKIQADQKTLQADIKSAAPTLKTDHQNLDKAIQAAQSTTAVQDARTKLQDDIKSSQTTIQADWQALRAATGTARSTAWTKLVSDIADSIKLYANDRQAIQDAINSDPGVQAAQAQLKTDSAQITTDQNNLKADYTQLWTDIKSGK